MKIKTFLLLLEKINPTEYNAISSLDYIFFGTIRLAPEVTSIEKPVALKVPLFHVPLFLDLTMNEGHFCSLPKAALLKLYL